MSYLPPCERVLEQLDGVCPGQRWASPLGGTYWPQRITADGQVEVLVGGAARTQRRSIFIDTFLRFRLVEEQSSIAPGREYVSFDPLVAA